MNSHMNGSPKQKYNLINNILLLILFLMPFYLQSCAMTTEDEGSVFEGVQIGVITYSYRSLPDQSIEGILNYVTQSQLSSVELMGGAVEQYAEIPVTKDPEVIRNWRSSVSMDKFEEVRKMFKSRGVKINILKLGNYKWSDEEIDYAFNVCKVLGAKGISMEISEEAAKRMSPFAEKHNLFVIFHNHGQPGDPDFSFSKYLAYGPNLMLNLDVGHYYGATGQDVKIIMETLHDRIVSIHVKDKTGPSSKEPNKNMPFGEGETNLDEVLQLIRDNRWPVTCDIELEYQIPEGSDALSEMNKCVQFCKLSLEEKTQQ